MFAQQAVHPFRHSSIFFSPQLLRLSGNKHKQGDTVLCLQGVRRIQILAQSVHTGCTVGAAACLHTSTFLRCFSQSFSGGREGPSCQPARLHSRSPQTGFNALFTSPKPQFPWLTSSTCQDKEIRFTMSCFLTRPQIKMMKLVVLFASCSQSFQNQFCRLQNHRGELL